MIDLHTRIVAAVQAKLELARAATPGPWIATNVIYGPPEDGNANLDWEIEGVVSHVRYEGGGFHRGEDARHVAANDPATVIRHCERDLRVLERHEPDQDGICWHDDWAEPWPCDEIRDLATAHGLETAP